MDVVDQVVMTETQKELLNEIQKQYEMRRDRWEQSGGNPDDMVGKMTCHLPFEMLREAFKAIPPQK